jgi:hypothetical protein
VPELTESPVPTCTTPCAPVVAADTETTGVEVPVATDTGAVPDTDVTVPAPAAETHAFDEHFFHAPAVVS